MGAHSETLAHRHWNGFRSAQLTRLIEVPSWQLRAKSLL
jgi:hypothetical protein